MYELPKFRKTKPATVTKLDFVLKFHLFQLFMPIFNIESISVHPTLR